MTFCHSGRFWLWGLLLLLASCSADKPDIAQQSYQRLEQIRDRKAAQLMDYMHNVDHVASAVLQDTTLIELFQQKLSAYRQRDEREDAQQILRSVRDQIEDLYIDRYLMFSDLIFIDPSGEIFFTLRKKDDYGKNIFKERLSQYALSKSLTDNHDRRFVDFEQYEIAGEPAAFFVARLDRDSEHHGWIVLRFSLDKVNDIFSFDEDLGRTGEVFLVNRERAMLTDSRFSARSTALNRYLSAENISQKFQLREGRKAVTDYRGHAVYSAFTVVKVLGSEWLLIAKLDQDEAQTEHFLQNSNDSLLQLEQSAVSLTIASSEAIALPSQGRLEVDWDELRRADIPGEILYTHGVRTCTTIIVSYPGRFAYLAHISANDRLYGGDKTDLLAMLLQRIDRFDIADAAREQLQVAVISPRPQYAVNLVEALARWGLMLSQIKMAFKPAARYVNITHDFRNAESLLDWQFADFSRRETQTLDSYPDLAELMRQDRK